MTECPYDCRNIAGNSGVYVLSCERDERRYSTKGDCSPGDIVCNCVWSTIISIVLYEHSPGQYLTSTVSWTTKQQELEDMVLMVAALLLRVAFKDSGAIRVFVELIEESSCLGRAPDDVKMLVDEALYPNGDAALLLSLVTDEIVLIYTGILPWKKEEVASITAKIAQQLR